MPSEKDAEYTDFVTHRSRSLFRTAYLLTGGDHGLAEDLLQTALVKTYLSWERIRAREAAEAYARRTIVTTATSWFRLRSWRADLPVADLPERASPGSADQVVDREVVWRAIRALPARQRAVVVLRYYEDLTERQTADAMGCSVGNVKSQTHAALASLRRRLGDFITLEPTGGST